MQKDIELDLNLDAEGLNRNLQYFCGTVLVYYHDILTEREFSVCSPLIKGQSIQSVAKPLGLTRERVRQIFHKAIHKIREAHQETINKIESIKEENEKLKRRNLLLEEEYLSESGLKYVESVLTTEDKLCRNAKRLLNTPIAQLPLPPRVKNALNSAKVSRFSEIPMLSESKLLGIKNCGRKAINDLQTYLQNYSLHLNMTYEVLVERMAKLRDKDISIEEHGEAAD